MGLWGDDFSIESQKEQNKKILDKAKSKKEVKIIPEKAIKSKTVSIEDKLRIISDNVHRILGRYEENTLVIRTKPELITYIDKCIQNNIIAIDTETNNSLDPLTCKLMGACIYTPGEKNVYIPVNHTDLYGNRLEVQLTEQDIKEQFDRLSNTIIVMHNGKFDYEVIKCTCNCTLHVDWDTMVGARVLNENERAGLKQQYIEKIDNSVEKYSIDHLFEAIQYAVVDPELFALYAATDSFMTYKLYEYQKKIFEQPENKNLYNLFKTVEMPVMLVAADMELTGVCLDLEYAKRLGTKYHKLYSDLEEKMYVELKQYDEQIAKWRLTEEANYKPPKKTGEGLGKSKNEQLENPVNLASPTQLAILLYDILGAKIVDKKSPRATGEEVLKAINLPICDSILEQRGLLKLINTYIDKLPDCLSPIDNRLHASFNQYGADTGRFSSSNPNLQNIPSHENSIRMLFTASCEYKDKELQDNHYVLSDLEEVQLSDLSWKRVKDLQIGDKLYCEDDAITTIDIIKNITINDNTYIIEV